MPASTRAAKRAAVSPASPAPAEKRPKQDPLLAGVADAISQARELPEACRSMLLAAVPGCLGAAVEDRHDHQATLVAWIGEVIDGVRATMQTSLEEAEAAERRAAEAKQGLDANVQGAKAVLQGKQEAVAAGSSSLADASAATAEAKRALAEAEEAQRAGDARLSDVDQEKRGLEEALEQHVAPMKEAEGFDASQAGAHVAAVMPIAECLVDDSLTAALPSVAVRPPLQRGAFDCMVLDQLETSLRSKAAALAGELRAGAPASAERADAVSAAREGLRAAEDAEKAAEAALEASRAEEAEAAGALGEAEAAVESFAAGRGAEVEALEQRRFALQNFVGYNVECFTALRSRSAPARA